MGFILFLLAALYLYCLFGRRNHPGMDALKDYPYTHRGLHDAEKPENSLAAFRATVAAGYGSELDVHLLKDGTLAVFHDSVLQRMTGKEGVIEDLTREELSSCYLAGSDETIPLFDDVLEIFEGKQPLIIELKPYRDNVDALCQAVAKRLDSYTGLYCIESFDPRCIEWYRKHRKDVVRGQLAENFLKHKGKGNKILLFACGFLLCNVIGRPDFIAYQFDDRKNLSCFLCRHLFGIRGVSWTIRSKQDYEEAISEGWTPIFENFIP